MNIAMQSSSQSPEYTALPSPSPSPSVSGMSDTQGRYSQEYKGRTKTEAILRRLPLWMRRCGWMRPSDFIRNRLGLTPTLLSVVIVILLWFLLQATLFSWSMTAVEPGLDIPRSLPQISVAQSFIRERELADNLWAAHPSGEEAIIKRDQRLRGKIAIPGWLSLKTRVVPSQPAAEYAGIPPSTGHVIARPPATSQPTVKAIVNEGKESIVDDHKAVKPAIVYRVANTSTGFAAKPPIFQQPAHQLPKAPSVKLADQASESVVMERAKPHIMGLAEKPALVEHAPKSGIVEHAAPASSSEPPIMAPVKTPTYSEDELFMLRWNYLLDEKAWPYVGSADTGAWKLGGKTLPGFYNQVAVFPGQNDTRQHGILGLTKEGHPYWKPHPMPLPATSVPGGIEAALKNGGFYLPLSDALSLDRISPDGRDKLCLDIKYDPIRDLGGLDATIIITFYNEPFSTLIRSVHSVLNLTPAHLIREIILVDDHSNITENEPGGLLDQYVELLPKVKLMRLPERRGIVIARLAGAKLAKAPVLVILDSHIEVNVGWLEPQLARIHASPKSIVFPQIYSIESQTFDYNNRNGIGCFLSFKWMMQERSYLQGKVTNADPIASPSMAGGLFSVKTDWFWELGGYDEEFSMWGAENVEMGFRVWMCGGRMECTPCARMYHIYRHKGSGYTTPSRFLQKNRLRTARLWTGHFFPLAERFISAKDNVDLGSFDKMLDLQEDLKCRNFSWYLEHVDVRKVPRDLASIEVMGEFRNEQHKQYCLDSLAESEVGKPFGVFGCHGQGGTQGFLVARGANQIRLHLDESRCLGAAMLITDCEQPDKDSHWDVRGDPAGIDKRRGAIRWVKDSKAPSCLTVVLEAGSFKLKLNPCDANSHAQQWVHSIFKLDKSFKLLEHSDAWIRKKRRRQENRHKISIS